MAVQLVSQPVAACSSDEPSPARGDRRMAHRERPRDRLPECYSPIGLLEDRTRPEPNRDWPTYQGWMAVSVGLARLPAVGSVTSRRWPVGAGLYARSWLGPSFLDSLPRSRCSTWS